MNNILRTFISINVPNQVLSVRDMLMTTVDDPKNRINWVRKGRIHLTLRFIGPTPEDGVPSINEMITRAADGISLPELEIKGTGCFPSPDRPRVLWLGLDGDLDPLRSLVADIDNRLEKEGYLKDTNEFIPHITLGRIKYPPKQPPGIETFLNTVYEPVKMRCTKIQYLSSALKPNGPVYSILGTHNIRD